MVDIEKIIAFYSKQKLSLLGKITVIKSLAIPKLVYLFTVLPHPGKDFMATLKKGCLTNSYGGNKVRIAPEQFELDIHEEGLKLTDIDLFLKCLKISWLQITLVIGICCLKKL